MAAKRGFLRKKQAKREDDVISRGLLFERCLMYQVLSLMEERHMKVPDLVKATEWPHREQPDRAIRAMIRAGSNNKPQNIRAIDIFCFAQALRVKPQQLVSLGMDTLEECERKGEEPPIKPWWEKDRDGLPPGSTDRPRPQKTQKKS